MGERIAALPGGQSELKLFGGGGQISHCLIDEAEIIMCFGISLPGRGDRLVVMIDGVGDGPFCGCLRSAGRCAAPAPPPDSNPRQISIAKTIFFMRWIKTGKHIFARRIIIYIPTRTS